MSPGRSSRTAEAVAAIRAAEMIVFPPRARIFEDPIAARLVRPELRLLMKAPPLFRLLYAWHGRWYRGVRDEVAARARYAQQRLALAAADGVRQVVVLGAGFDATAWLPGLPPDLKVFEIDDPDTQRLKRLRLACAGVAEPAGVVFVPHDLGRGSLRAALRGAGHRPDTPSFVTALGVIPYLAPERVCGLFAAIASACAPGSEMVCTFFSREALDPERASPGARRLARRLRGMGEPLLFAADPGEMAVMLERCGLELVESLDGDALTERYFPRPADGRGVGKWVNLARAVIARSPSESGV
jgi:methyltransferase (TIGR00027 family)